MKNALITIIGAAVLTFVLIIPGIQAADTLQQKDGFAPDIVERDGLAPIRNLSFEATEAEPEKADQTDEAETGYIVHLNDIVIESEDVQLATYDANVQEAMLELTNDTKRLLPFLMEQLGLEQLPDGWFYDLAANPGDMSLTMGDGKFIIFNNPLATYDENHGRYYVMLYPDAESMPVGFVTDNNPAASILLLLEDQ